MIRNYFKIAYRNLLKNKAYSLINISGLAVGMAVAILIGLWIYDELSYDRYHESYDRVARVMQHQTANGETGSQFSIPFPLGKELQTTYGTSFKYVAMSSWVGGHILSTGDRKLSKTGVYMDIDAPHIFTLKMKYGTRNGLRDPHSILLSESAAKAFFGDANPLEKRLKIDNKLDVKVTGVFEDLPHNTDFRELEFIAPWLLYVESEDWIKRARDRGQWGNNSFQLFAQIADNTDFETVGKRIKLAKYNRVDKDEKKYKAEIFLHPLSRWRLYSHWDKQGNQTGGQIEYVWLFAIIGVFVLLLACINFMNLSTARSEKRAREVGIRKAIGSLRSQLIGQFFSESLLVVLIAMALSILLVELSLPWFNEIAGKKMSVLWSNPVFWGIVVSFAFLTGLLAGSYPALYLSSFQPVSVLKGTFRAGRYASVPRKVLVTLQFTVSVTLIIGTLIVYRQIQHTKNRPVGYSREGLVMMQMKSPDFYGKFDVLRNEWKNTGAVVEMAESSSPVTGLWSSNGGFEWQGKDPNLDAEFATVWVTPEFGKLVNWHVLKGRDFSRQRATDSLSVIINQSGVKFASLKDPVGTVLKWDGKNYTIIGVVQDLIQESPYHPVSPGVYFMDSNNVNWINLKLNPAQSASASLAKIESVFKRLVPTAPFDYQFVDQVFGEKFAAEERVGKLAAFFASLAIFISCLGLFGLASFMAEQRTKEIGIRKVLGASVLNLWGLLSKDFVGLVVLSCAIAVPLAWYGMANWLEKYEYRTDITWWVFLLAAVGALTITLLTVSYQAVRAAMMNPVRSLKAE
ncbi:ABC transporter permease [Siphonobacter aquaeclarae]|uniref:ABC-type transport system, involved in lipoprotein release, permease component n=1 Tax=Siphonobacter aquaeclarae TaxID=563176 RepID=A0A1G9LHI9_9BACT|nr:ABC transporter permease [Siphonobacter aquaeclarae]SDL61371.1 ABC-type transport system, involved in lipoprotein release, permease component [Siphonobacter aquaeclarae]